MSPDGDHPGLPGTGGPDHTPPSPGDPGPASRPSRLPLLCLASGLLGFLVIPAIVGLVAGIRARRRGTFGRAARLGLGLSAAWLLVAAIASVPIFLRAREAGRRVTCLVNVKNLAIALSMYATDWDRFPMAHNWCDALIPYAASERTFRCPSAPSLRSAYGYNTALALGMERWIDGSPSEVVVVAEADADWNGSATARDLELRHRGGAHIAFADGRAAWVTQSDLQQVVWNPFPKPIPPLVLPPQPLLLRHPAREADEYFRRVTAGDQSVIPELRRALARLSPRKHGGIRWAPPLVNVLLASGDTQLEAAAYKWLRDHEMASLRVRYTDYGVSLLLGCDRDPAGADSNLALAYECGPYRLRLTVLLLPEEAYNYPDDPDWHGVSVLQVDPRGDEEGLRSSRWSNPLGVVTTRAAGRPPTDNTQWRWVALSETVNDRRLTYERSTDSRDWRWASSAR